VHLDEAFTAQRLMDVDVDVSERRFPVLHLASHFRFSLGTAANSFLLGDGQQLTLGELTAQKYQLP
jgi:CHAT domain-containing protein